MRTLIPTTLALLITTVTFAVDPVSPFNGKDLSGWSFKGDKEKSKWTVGVAKMDDKDNGKLTVSDAAEGKGELVNPSSGVDIYTNEKFGDCSISLEVMVPKGSNSGVY